MMITPKQGPALPTAREGRDPSTCVGGGMPGRSGGGGVGATGVIAPAATVLRNLADDPPVEGAIGRPAPPDRPAPSMTICQQGDAHPPPCLLSIHCVLTPKADECQFPLWTAALRHPRQTQSTSRLPTAATTRPTPTIPTDPDTLESPCHAPYPRFLPALPACLDSRAQPRHQNQPRYPETPSTSRPPPAPLRAPRTELDSSHPAPVLDNPNHRRAAVHGRRHLSSMPKELGDGVPMFREQSQAGLMNREELDAKACQSSRADLSLASPPQRRSSVSFRKATLARATCGCPSRSECRLPARTMSEVPISRWFRNRRCSPGRGRRHSRRRPPSYASGR
jgi:hypothetical protein